MALIGDPFGAYNTSAYDALNAQLASVFNEYVNEYVNEPSPDTDLIKKYLLYGGPPPPIKKGHKKHHGAKATMEPNYYDMVGHALGFTQEEIQALVTANDTGLSFATIATLIEEHPPVLSSARTPKRVAEETMFIANVTAATKHHAASKPKYFVQDFSWKQVPNQIMIKSTPKGYDDLYDWLMLSMYATTSNVYESIAKTGVNSFASWTGKPKYGLISPAQPGELAKLMGIWTP